MRTEDRKSPLLEPSDFARRKRHGTLHRIGFCYFASMAMFVYLVGAMEDPSVAHYVLLFIAFGLLTAYSLYSLQKNLDLITDIEFQNAIFSSALGEQSLFTLVVNDKGGLLYADENLYAWFPNTKRESDLMLNSFFDAASIAQNDRDKFLRAITQSRSESMVIGLQDQRGYSRLIRLTLRPVPRPHGVFILQGREFIVSRSIGNAQEMPAAALESPVNFITTLLEHSTQALFAVSPSGYLRVATPAMEKLLGYGAGEMLQKKLLYIDLFYKPDNQAHPLQEERSLDTTVMLAHKNGSIVKARLVQQPLSDEDENRLATIGLVERM